MKGVHSPPLSDAIDSADSLLETHRVPRELEVDDEPAVVVQVQAFARRIGGEQNGPRRARECRQRGPSFVWTQPAVQQDDRQAQGVADMNQRVAILRED